MTFGSAEFNPPPEWLRIETIDLHAGGEPLRVVLKGWPPPQGNTVLERRRYVQTHQDHLRTALMHEPRGHADMYGCLIVPPNDESADFGVIFMHNIGYSTMCGHAVIALARLAAECEWVTISGPETFVKIDAPCGRITARVWWNQGKVERIAFEGVPSFALSLDQEQYIPGIGDISYDLAFGGTFYAYVNGDRLGMDLLPAYSNEIIRKGMAIKQALASDKRISHPFEPDLSFLYGVIFIGKPHSKGADSRNVCVFADGELDRSPTGSGVMGRLAIHLARGEISKGETMRVESITGSIFKGSISKTIRYGKHNAIIPVVEGEAYGTGKHTFLIDPDDPFRKGFLLR